MKKILLIILSLAMSEVSFSQVPKDSVLWEKMMFAYIEALKADIKYNKDLRFAAMVADWKQPLENIYDNDSIEGKKNEMEAFLSDTLIVCSDTQREEVRAVVNMLGSYEAEARKMIEAFKMTDAQMTSNLKYLTSATMVHSFCQMYLRNWFDQSPLPAFSRSKIPYLARIAEELKQMVNRLCSLETATPELLHEFLDTEYRISKCHTKGETAK